MRNPSFFGIIGPAMFLAAVSGGSAGVPSGLGWYELPDTQLQSVCPANDFGGYGYPFSDRCASVTIAWNGGAFDPTRNRLLIWGGGHNDYGGNEIYALDMTDLKFRRLTDPARPAGADECPESLADGTQPNARHTYNGLAYMKNVDRFFAMGGVEGYLRIYVREHLDFRFQNFPLAVDEPLRRRPAERSRDDRRL